MNKLFTFYFLLFTLFISFLLAETIEIKQDGTGNFTTIQEGINASADTDTVLVYPGTYYENIIYNGKNITVASLELITGNAAYIDSTIIDGQRLDSCVRVMAQETDATIRGFILTNGQGHPYQYSAGDRGGGVLVYDHCTFNITNCIIKKNYASSGGGIYLGYYSIINISGTSILNNYVFFIGGGVVVSDNSQLIFDADNRCNIYDNFGASGLDIYLACCEYLNVIVDTFSILNPTRYYANFTESLMYSNTYTFDILNSSLEQVNQDLYISWLGDDNNSGLSPNEPMKTINLAIRKIVSDSIEPKTIYIESGIYAESLNNLYFAIGGKSFINIIGEDMETTIIDGEFNFHPLLYIGPGTNHCSVKDLTFQNNTNSNYMLSVNYSNNIFFNNLIVQNHIGTDHGTVMFNNCGNVGLTNVKILNNTSLDQVTGLHLPDCDNIYVIGCVIKNNHAGSGDIPLCGGMQATSTGDILIENSVFSGNVLIANDWSSASALALGGFASTSGKFTILNCLFENNQCLGTADKTVLLDCYDDIEIVNSTFVDNTSEYTLSLIRNHIDFHNNILRNNCNYEIVLADNSPWGYISEIDISHCNILGGQNAIYNQNCVNIVNWLEGNIDEDPLFIGTVEQSYLLSPLSPCIDAGTPDTTGLFLPPWDLLHNHRVWDGNGDGVAIIDMGCYEFGAEHYVEIINDQLPVTDYQLTNYPNPFNPETKIVLNLPEEGNVKLEIYNIKGQKVKTLLDCYMSPGRSEMIWNGEDDNGKRVSSGIYFYQFVTDKKTITKKMILIK
jgi:hypothetical protein